MKNIITFIITISCVLLLNAQSTDKHYIKTTTYNYGDGESDGADQEVSIVNYNNFTVSITLAEMFTCPVGTTVGGVGGGTVTINNNNLTLSFGNSGNTSCSMKLGPIKQLNTTPMLPDMDLGPIPANNSTDMTTYRAKIKDGWLYFYSRQHLGSVGGSIIAEFSGSPVATSTTTGFPIFACGGGGGGGGGGTNTINLFGNTITINLISSWGPVPTCNVMLGDLITMGVTVPDTEIGVIKSNGFESAYRLKIQNNKLVAYSNETISPTITNFFYYPSTTFDLSQNPNTLINGEIVTYYTDGGNPTLLLQYEAQSNKLWGKEFNYDVNGRRWKETYPMPLSISAGYGFSSFFDYTYGVQLYSYYSNSNTQEPYQPTATQPYSQINYDKLNPGNIINATGGNMVNGVWKTGYKFTVPASQELYYMFGKDYFPGIISGLGKEVVTKYHKTVAIDQNGNENVTFMGDSGQVLATARSGGATKYSVVSLIGAQGYVDVHIPLGTSSLDVQLIGSSADYQIFNLMTGNSVTMPLTPGNCYRIVSLTPPPATNPQTFISSSGAINYDISNAAIRGIRYKVNYYDYALNVYDPIRRLVKIIQPKITQVVTTVPAVPAHMSATGNVMTLKYNTLGKPTEISSPDEGLSKYLYRSDGQLRYSQNANQAGKVSYVEYDTYGRAVESGILTTAVAWTSLNPDAALATGTRSERAFIVYDGVLSPGLPIPPSYSTILGASGLSVANYMQKNIAGNVSMTYKEENGYAATWYSYDLYGRVSWILQYTNTLMCKTLHYYYDKNGNVSKVIYQKDVPAEYFEHSYEYNKANDLSRVRTSSSGGANTTIHADYEYYLNGKLKRLEYAEGIQGVDYVYTLGGLLKSINHPSLEQAKDPGGDSNDLFGVSLDYYAGDYLRSGNNITTSSAVPGYNNDLYTGAIRAVRFANKSLDWSGSTALQKAYMYKYNKNNWLTDATFGTVSSTNTITPTGNYKESNITYDPNGNITALKRSNEAGSTYDDLSYTYNSGKNQLNYVTDAAGSTASPITYDIEPQSPDNYEYNAIGQMTKNNLEGLQYFYNADALLTEVQKSGQPLIKLYYNERKQRVKKETYSTVSPYPLQSTDIYVYDLYGNIVALHNKLGTGGAITLKEYPVYGHDRLGVYYKATASTNYELKDHLGNVRAVFKKISNAPSMQNYADYYPFGEQLPARNAFSNYRFAFQGQLLDQETGMESFPLRLWDGRIGRWLCPDPYGQYMSPYIGMGNNPISGIDIDGGYVYILGKDGLLYLAVNAVLNTIQGKADVGKFIDDPNNHLIITTGDLTDSGGGIVSQGNTIGPLVVTEETALTASNIDNLLAERLKIKNSDPAIDKEVLLKNFNNVKLQPGNNYMITIDVKAIIETSKLNKRGIYELYETVWHEPAMHAHNRKQSSFQDHMDGSGNRIGNYSNRAWPKRDGFPLAYYTKQMDLIKMIYWLFPPMMIQWDGDSGKISRSPRYF